MAHQRITLRHAVITTMAVGLGSGTGTLVDALAEHASQPALGAGRLAGALVSLWVFEKLDRVIEDPR